MSEIIKHQGYSLGKICDFDSSISVLPAGKFACLNAAIVINSVAGSISVTSMFAAHKVDRKC